LSEHYLPVVQKTQLEMTIREHLNIMFLMGVVSLPASRLASSVESKPSLLRFLVGMMTMMITKLKRETATEMTMKISKFLSTFPMIIQINFGS